MTASPQAIMANSWLRWVHEADGDTVVVTMSYVGNAVQFLAAITRVDGTFGTISYLRGQKSAPLRVEIPIRPGKSFLFDEITHNLTNVAEVDVFRAAHQAAVDAIFNRAEPAEEKKPSPFVVIEGGKT